jgi:heme A synthase
LSLERECLEARSLVIWLVRLKESAWMRQLLWATLGANIVLDLVAFETNPLPAAIRISHTLLGQLFFSTTVVIAIFTSKSWNQIQKPVENASRLRPRATTTAALVLLQVALGAAFRHGAMGALPHILGALVLAVFLGRQWW